MPSLQPYSSFGLNVSCMSIETFNNVESFLAFYHSNTTIYLLGGGTNSIFTEDFEGTVLVNGMKGISYSCSDTHHYLRVGAGENWHDFVTLCVRNGWHGLENLALIPGSVGASPIQNIGAYGLEVESFIDSVEVLMLDSENLVTLSNEECEFGYRDSVFKQALANRVLITHVNFSLPKDFEIENSYAGLADLSNATPEDIYHKVIEIRRSKLPDPEMLGNAGSFFKNPIITQRQYNKIAKSYDSVPCFVLNDSQPSMVKIPAAWLIEKSGFKGKCYNQVRCHPTQPLVLTNLGTASGSDVIHIAKDIMATVKSRFGVELEIEVRIVGNKGLISL